MLKMKSFFIVAFAIVCFAISASAQRGPSTPDERKRAVEIATFLETTPLAKEAKDHRAKLLFFLAEVPDITIKLCTNVLGETKRMKGDYDSELVGQLAFSQAKFVIEHPDKAQDDAAVYLAGVEGVLRTWQAIKTQSQKQSSPLWKSCCRSSKPGH